MKPAAALLLSSSFCLAQVYQPPAQPATQPANPYDSSAAPEKKPTPSPFGQEIPMLDPSAETITIGGVTIPLLDNRLLKSRFEKYLNQPPESGEAAEDYRRTIAEILDILSPLRSTGERPNLKAAFQRLPAAATYEGDAQICRTLAEAIYTSMLAKKDVNGLRSLNEALEDEKQQTVRDADWMARHERDPGIPAPRPRNGGNAGGGGNRKQDSDGTGAQSMRYMNMMKRIAEIEVLKKGNIGRVEAQTVVTKTQYQVNMVQWFMQRRYEHVLMASRFYNQIWKDGDTALRINKDSDVSKLFSQSVGVNPTISSLDSLSSEAIREAQKYVEAFDHLLAKGELHAASNRLMEAFAIGEFLAPLATLPLDKKVRVQQYWRDLNELYGAVQARDFETAKTINARLKKAARDYPSSKADSVISGLTLKSDLLIEDAKGLLLSRESEKAAAKIGEAAEVWPTNPKLEEFRKLVGNLAPAVTSRNDFDRLLTERNFREIARRQYEFAPAIQGDATREDAFRQIIGNLTKIESALAKAREFGRMGQNYAAYEQLAELRGEFPDDPELGRELEGLAPKVADFTKALDRARQLENGAVKQTGSALSWYLKARSIHPPSKFAAEGVRRLAREILPPDGSPEPAAPAPSNEDVSSSTS
jgi:hypothetical protein